MLSGEKQNIYIYIYTYVALFVDHKEGVSSAPLLSCSLKNSVLFGRPNQDTSKNVGLFYCSYSR